jgi:hypothetical protein
VVGAPSAGVTLPGGTDSKAWLSEAARVGGTAMSSDCSDQGPNFCHFDLSTVSDFGEVFPAALLALTPRTRLACTQTVALSPDFAWVDKRKLTVIYRESTGLTTTSYLVASNGNADCQYGWHYVDAAQTTLEICQPLCERIQNASSATLELVFDCGDPFGPI